MKLLLSYSSSAMHLTQYTFTNYLPNYTTLDLQTKPIIGHKTFLLNVLRVVLGVASHTTPATIFVPIIF